MSTYRKAGMAAGLLLVSLLAACSPAAGAAPENEETESPALTAEATDVPTVEVTAEPTELATEAVIAESGSGLAGITFTADASLGMAAGAVIPAEPFDPNGPYWVLPEHYRFDLTGYPTTSSYHAAQIYVFPVANFEGYPEQALYTVDQLKTLLAGRPDLSTMGGMQNPLPLLPLFNAAQVVVAHPQYLDFQNGSGIRFLTQYDQGPLPINNDELFYTFQGITNDGQFYVSLILPVSHPDLPANGMMTQEQMDEMTAKGEQYFVEMTGMLNAADPASFTPNVGLLDQLVQSLKVTP